MTSKTLTTMNKSDLLVRIAGLPDGDKRIHALAAALANEAAPACPVSLRLFNMGAAAKELNVSRPTFWRMVRDGTVRTVELRKGLRRVPESELRRIVEGRSGFAAVDALFLLIMGMVLVHAVLTWWAAL